MIVEATLTHITIKFTIVANSLGLEMSELWDASEYWRDGKGELPHNAIGAVIDGEKVYRIGSMNLRFDVEAKIFELWGSKGAPDVYLDHPSSTVDYALQEVIFGKQVFG